MRARLLGPALVPALVLGLACQPKTALDRPSGGTSPWLREATACMACHDRLTTTSGEDVSFGTLWQASLMANSARDPYWQASMRREVSDHPTATATIEDECSRCHMPMGNEHARAAGRTGRVFANLPGQPGADPLAVDGVACSLCHQISPARLGEPASFSGGYVIAANTWPAIYGPYELAPQQASLMQSVLGVQPVQGAHIRQSELCATCHTLYTRTLDAQGHTTGTLPEQVPYLEWQQSAFRDSQSCQSCHMPAVNEATLISSVHGLPHQPVARHDFRGANSLVLGMLDRHRSELSVTAPGAAMQGSIATTRAFLTSQAARVAIVAATRTTTSLSAEIDVENLGGHKLPTAYPSRRAWLHVTVRDGAGRTRFESGRLLANGAIEGNDNDLDATHFEPHHAELHTADEVQIYESILGDEQGHVTTGLLQAARYLKDNRLLPRGFPKATALPDTAVHGEAESDPDFLGGHDRVRLAIDVGEGGPLTLEVELLYQPIGYRWAHNLAPYPASEAQRFVRYFAEMAGTSTDVLAHATTVVP
jgi:hypothetical protein